RIDRPARSSSSTGRSAIRRAGVSAAPASLRGGPKPRAVHPRGAAAPEAPAAGGRAGVPQRAPCLCGGVSLCAPPADTPDRPEVLDVVDQRSAGQRHQQGPVRTGPDAAGEREDVLRALRGLVLDEVSLVYDHAPEAEVTEPAHVAVENLVVEHDDIGESV